MINAAAITKIRTHVVDALSKGATRATAIRDLGDAYADPVVLVGATMDMKLASEETFGPVAPIFRLDADEEALGIAHGIPFDLSACFFTRNLSRAFRVGEAMEFGLFGLNTGGVSHEVAPFGRVKFPRPGGEGVQKGSRASGNPNLPLRRLVNLIDNLSDELVRSGDIQQTTLPLNWCMGI